MSGQNSATVVIKTKMDNKAVAATQKLARATEEAAKQEAKYQKMLGGRAAAGGLGRSAGRQLGSHLGAGRIGGFLGGQLGGSLGGAGAAVGLAAAAFGAVTLAADKAASAIEVMNNGAMTAAQKQDQFTKMMPGGETYIKLRDAIAGVTESMRLLALEHQNLSLAQANAQEKKMREVAGQAEVDRAANLGTAYNRARVPDTLNKLAGGRGTYAGQLAYEEAAARFGPQAALSRAEEEAKAARKDYGASGARRVDLEANRVRLIDRMDKARAAEEQAVKNGNAFGANAGDNKVARTAAGLNALRAEQEVLNNEARIEAEINRQKDLGVTLAQKESAARQAQNGMLKAELQLLQQKEQRQSGAAQALGSMNPAQRAMAVQAVKMAQQVGDVGMLPPSLRGLAQQVAPGMMGKLTEKSGENSKEFKELQGLGAVDKGSLDETRREVAKTQTQVEVNVNLDTEAMAKKIAEALGKSLDALVKSIDAKAQASGEKMRTGIQLKNAQQ